MQVVYKLSSHAVKIALLALYSVAALTLMTSAVFNVHAAGIPENVTGFTATPIDAASLGLSWNAAKDGDGAAVDHYRIYYGTVSIQTTGSGEYQKAVNTPNNSTSYVVGGLTAKTTYYFAMTAVNAQGTESELYSQEASAATKDATAIAAATATETTPAVTAPPETTPTPPATTPPATTTPPPAMTKSAPTVESVEALTKTTIKVVFNKAVKLPVALPETAFKISEQINPAKELAVTGAILDVADKYNKTVVLTTQEQTKDVNYVATAGVSVTDADGNPIESGNRDSGLFLGTDKANEVAKDTTPPEDIADLLLSFKQQVNRFIVLMDWTASINSAKDLVDQLLYMSLDRGVTYAKGQSLGAIATHAEKSNLKGGNEYTFKITTKDAVGNESVGVVKSIRLPQTGVAAGIFLLGSAALAERVLRRKKQK
ncbi:fibronectin type III domain-containing protein [Candidatus Peregrinibacteria bacterium]|nr:fibronectin type III domain-containing protein [Candidatus Peregrinibacteria bacterium]